jgi:hypothetical protein
MTRVWIFCVATDRRQCGQHEENGRAEMSDPAREKQRFGRLIEICGTHAGNAEVVPDVIPRHQDHNNDAANDVNRFETDAVDGDTFDYRRHPTRAYNDNCSA